MARSSVLRDGSPLRLCVDTMSEPIERLFIRPPGRISIAASGGVTASYARSIGDFLTDLTNGGRSPHTVRGYRGDLAAFAAHRPGGADTIDVGVLRGCLATLTGLSPATRVRYTPWGGCTDSSM